MGVRVVFPDMGKDPSVQLIEKTITENGTYDAITDGANGYSKVNVNVEGGGGSSDLVPLEFQYVPKTRGYESVKTLGEIIADADSMNQCITFTSEYFSEGIPTGYTEGSTYRLIYADSISNTADVRFVPTDRVYSAEEILITGSGSKTFPLSIDGK